MINANNLITFAKTIYGEARGESFDGRLAVGWVVFNRMKLAQKNKRKASQFGLTISDVCKKKWQFSCWNENDPNFKIINDDKILNDPIFNDCLYVADGILGSLFNVDVTIGATHYHSRHVDFPKSWGDKKTPCVVIGNHLFYNNVA